MSIKLDMLELDELFVEAGRTELLMPRQKAKGITTSWLDIKEEWSAYGYGHKRPLKLGRMFKCDRRTVQHNYRGALMRAYYMQ